MRAGSRWPVSWLLQLYALVDHAAHLWEPILADIKFPQTGVVVDTDWMSPDIPPSRFDLRLRVPPRINGGIRDDYSSFVHPRDKQARSRGLVLASSDRWRFDQTTGILEDFFRSENSGGSCCFIPRALPIECKACRVMLSSYPALVSHCKQWSHRQDMDDQHDRRVPGDFVDPRNTQSYHQHLSVFQKVMALKKFEHKFIALLHSPMDQDGIDNLTWMLNTMAENIVDRGELLRTVTFEKVREASIEFVLIDFYRNGIDGCSLDVVLGGWQAFGLPDFSSWNRLYSIITGTSLMAE
jgi:hypothetical protein